MQNRGLLFIPDISGFTRFVNEIEIEHSKSIIQELLEILINANEIGLEISEIEGDAILFYKYGDSPDLSEIYKQVQNMFFAFHRQLAGYEVRKYCQCKACVSAINLTLKVITHYGEFTSYTVKNFNKLIGKDIIVAHQLLKNDIPQHEYWLVTNSLLPDGNLSDVAASLQWNDSIKKTESGDILFKYAQLTDLKKAIPPEKPLLLGLTDKVKMISVSREYDVPIIPLFHASGDFNYRSRWREGVTKVEELSHFLPRIGMRCRCTMENGESAIYASSYSFHPERIEFEETDENKMHATHFTLETIGDNKTRLTLDYYIRKNLLEQALFNLTRKNKMEASLQGSLANLHELVKELDVPVIEQ
jgi:hypothetical protein